MIGKALTKGLLDKGYSVIILTRKLPDTMYKIWDKENFNPNPASRISYVSWNIQKKTIDADAVSKADYLIHLAGVNLGEKRWTTKRKQEIISSRVNSGKLIVESLTKIPNQVKAVISSSAIGYYGPDLPLAFSQGKSFEENDPSSNDFLGQTCRQWEESIEPITQLGKRIVKLRTGIVLSKEGGALPRFIMPLRFGLATILGSGKQIISWIHIEDLVRLYISAIENETISGVYNAVAPRPVSNKEFVLTLAKTRNKFFIPVRVPSFVLKIILGEMSIEVLKSATVNCKKIYETGFVFQYPEIKSAIKQLK